MVVAGVGRQYRLSCEIESRPPSASSTACQWVTENGCISKSKAESTVLQVAAEYSSPGEGFVSDACNPALHGYRRENYGCSGIEYERLDN